MVAIASLGAAVLAAGCGGGTPAPAPTAPRTATTSTVPPPRSVDARASTSSSCTDRTCTVRVTCDGTRRVRRGPAPVATRSSTVNARTTIVLDFAGASRDTAIRC